MHWWMTEWSTIAAKNKKFCFVWSGLQPNSLYDPARFVNFEGILGVFVPQSS